MHIYTKMVEGELTEIETIVLRYNRVAMDYLKIDNYKDTFILLKKAENILNNEVSENMPNRLKLVSITYNNLGCYYKKYKKPLVALSYLQRALELEIESDSDNTNIASSHLNICAILSSTARHGESLQHAKKAITLLEISKKTRPDSTRITSNLVVAYYNSAVELEHLGRTHEAYNSYDTALSIALKELGKNHPIIISLEHALEKLKDKLNNSKIEKFHTRDSSPSKIPIEPKHTRFPSITPSIPKVKSSRYTMTPGRVFPGRISPYDNMKSSSFKGSL